MRKLFALLALALALCCAAVRAAVPHQLNHQGMLLDATSAPVTGNVSMTFKLYTTAVGGVALYAETLNVAVDKGLYNALIGSITPLTLPFDVQYHLGITVGGDPEMSPRTPVAASAYAMRAASTESLATARTINGVAFDGTANITIPPTALLTGCPGPRIGGVCLVSYSNAQSTNFLAAAQACANLGADLCTDSQSWALGSLGANVLNGPRWTASFADNDGGQWNGANGGTGDDHPASTNYGYACCGGTTPPNPLVVTTTPGNVKITAVHNIADTTFAGAVAYCSALSSDICSDSQTLLLRDAGALTVLSWTNSHSDNDGSNYSAINGGTSDDTSPSQQYGFACCASRRPADLSCPVARTGGVCATLVHDTADTNFRTAAQACAAAGADLCSIGQSAVLRQAGSLTQPVWTNSHSDNDGNNAAVGVGTMADNPQLTTPAAYACCLN